MENKMFGEKPGYVSGAAGVLFVVLAVYVAVLAVNSIKENKYIGRETASMNTITVSGDSEVYANPDLATMDFSVVSEAVTVAAAMEDNTKKMNLIIDAVKSFGVAETDIKTSGFNISPRYDYAKETTSVSGGVAVPANDIYYYPSGKRVLSGYDVTQTLTVKMRDMSKIGQIIGEATASGANQVGDLQFTIDNPDSLQDQARQEAIVKAKTKAQVLAGQLGVKLGKISGYSEGGYMPTYSMNYAKGAAMDTAEAATPSIQTGQNKIESNVSITYEIE